MQKKKSKVKPVVHRSVKHATPSILTTQERSRLLRPITNYEEIADKAVNVWKNQRASVRIPGLTPERLAALIAKAKKAQLREKPIELKFQAAHDARMLADHEAWKSLLDLKAFVEIGGRRNPELLKAFDFVLRAFKHGESKPAAVEAPAQTVS